MGEEKNFMYSVDRFADLEILRYDVPGFDSLSISRKALVYYLSQAALEGRDILFDQNGKYNLRIRRLLEAVYLHFNGERDTDEFRAFEVYLKRVWFANGIYHHYSCDKFTPEFSQNFLENALKDLDVSFLPLRKNETADEIAPINAGPANKPP